MSSTEDHIAAMEARHRDEAFLARTERAFRQLNVAAAPVASSDYDAHCTYRIVRDSGMVLSFHPCYVSTVVQTRLFTATFEVHGHAGIDHVLGLMLAHTDIWSYNPGITVLPSVSPLPDDAYDNHLRLDVAPAGGVGAIACAMRRGEQRGGWFTRGDTRQELRLTWDYHNSRESRFPSNASISLDLLRRAVHEFFDLNGAGLPTCCAWQPAPRSLW